MPKDIRGPQPGHPNKHGGVGQDPRRVASRMNGGGKKG